MRSLRYLSWPLLLENKQTTGCINSLASDCTGIVSSSKMQTKQNQ